MMASLSITLAVSGMCSLICTPVALVLTGLNSPPVGAPGLRSQMSMVLGPPPIHIRMAPLPLFFSSAALAHMVSVNDRAAPAMALAPARCCIKCRRDMPWGVGKLIRWVLVSVSSGVTGVGQEKHAAKKQSKKEEKAWVNARAAPGGAARNSGQESLADSRH